MTMSNLETGAGDVSEERAEDADALYILGTRYSTGRDVEHDLIAAHKWFNLAAMMGHEQARTARAELAREMSAADIAEAQRRARAWLWERANAKTPFGKEAKATTADRPSMQSNRSLCA
jgi:uncharacterized protein